MKKVKCVNNLRAEDRLTIGKIYDVMRESERRILTAGHNKSVPQAYSVKTDDDGQPRWYYSAYFEEVDVDDLEYKIDLAGYAMMAIGLVVGTFMGILLGGFLYLAIDPMVHHMLTGK